MISARAVRQYAHLPGSFSQFLHQLTYHEEGILSTFTICEEGVFSRFPFDLFTLPLQIVDYVGEI